MPLVSTMSGNKRPLFSRPAQVEPGIPFVQETQSVVKGCRYSDTSSESPIFARPNQTCDDSHLQSQKRSLGFASHEHEWFPRMDVAESGLSYAVTLEIPGVTVDNIKLEVNNRSLVVTGSRSNWTCERATDCSNKSGSTYHKKEILQGPYRIVWPLPNNANKDHVSAEIQDGLLRVSIPKLSGLSLVVTGSRSNWTCERATDCSNKSGSTYHKKEILKGPYRIVWPLPKNANKDHVSA